MSKYECKKSLKRKSGKTEVQYAANVETTVFAIDVTPIRCLADYFQVHSIMGMDDGISGCKT